MRICTYAYASGQHLPLARIVHKEGGGPDGLRAACSYALRCLELGPPWALISNNWDPTRLCFSCVYIYIYEIDRYTCILNVLLPWFPYECNLQVVDCAWTQRKKFLYMISGYTEVFEQECPIANAQDPPQIDIHI